MASSAYFIDWRPVAFLPAHSPPIASKTKTRKNPHIGTTRLFPEGSIFDATIDQISYASRDDGIILFCIDFSQSFDDLVDTYYDMIPAIMARPPHPQQKVVRLEDPHLNAVDQVARVEGYLVFSTADECREALVHRAATHVAQYIKSALGHAHTFHPAPPTFKRQNAKNWPKRRERVENRILKVEPLRICLMSADEISETLAPDFEGQAQGLANATQQYVSDPLQQLRDDRLLVRIKQHSKVSRPSNPNREALFEMRRVYANMVDLCIQLLPEIKNQHFLARIPGLPLLKWPMSYFAFVLLVCSFVVFIPLTLQSFTGWPNFFIWKGYASETLFALIFLATIGFAHLEFGRRRGKVIDALQRTAGVLEFGAILSNAVSMAAQNAKMSRYGSQLEIDQKGSVRVIDRKCVREIEKRSRNKQLLGIAIGFMALFFSFAAARGNINDFFGWKAEAETKPTCPAPATQVTGDEKAATESLGSNPPPIHGGS